MHSAAIVLKPRLCPKSGSLFVLEKKKQSVQWLLFKQVTFVGRPLDLDIGDHRAEEGDLWAGHRPFLTDISV